LRPGQKVDSVRAGRVAKPLAEEVVLVALAAAEEVAFLLAVAIGAAEELTFWYWGIAWAMPAEKAMAATMLVKEGILMLV
jgi:hypothetical protein